MVSNQAYLLQGEVIMDNSKSLYEKLMELRDKETPEQRAAFLIAEDRYMAEQERLADLALELHIAQRYMK
jgi:hypothetical protein